MSATASTSPGSRSTPRPRAPTNTPASSSSPRPSRSTCSIRQRKNRVKLYVRRVFITDDCQELLPSWLRFLKGVVDSEDLPLNVSREMLQKNPMLARMRGQIARRVLSELGKKAKDAPEEYAKFWDNFGAVLKEGLYEDPEHRDQLLELARFRSTARRRPRLAR